MTALLAGLALGVASSAHCAAMCGPLILALREHAGTVPAGAAAARGLAYHAGRVAVYGGLGLAAGAVGRAAAVGGVGRVLAILSGTALLISAARRAGLTGARTTPGIGRTAGRTLARLSAWIRANGVGAPFVLGGLNGLLPCGLVYAAMTAAMSLGRPGTAALFMMAFGVGTIPSMFLVWMASAGMPATVRARLRLAAPVALALAGLVLIVRGVGPIDFGHAAVHVHVPD